MNTDLNRVIQKLCGAAICAALLTSTAIAREKANPLGSARQLKTDVAGLDAPAQILVDVWGIPHIYAGNAARRCSSCRASTPRATGSGRSISGASAGSACSRQDFGPAYAGRTALRAVPLSRRHGRGVGGLRPRGEDATRRRSSPASMPMSPMCARASVRCRSSSGSPARSRIRGRRTTSCASAATA